MEERVPVMQNILPDRGRGAAATKSASCSNLTPASPIFIDYTPVTFNAKIGHNAGGNLGPNALNISELFNRGRCNLVYASEILRQ